jgi:hypothetical protein
MIMPCWWQKRNNRMLRLLSCRNSIPQDFNMPFQMAVFPFIQWVKTWTWWTILEYLKKGSRSSDFGWKMIKNRHKWPHFAQK